jgi:hypothetical protein
MVGVAESAITQSWLLGQVMVPMPPASALKLHVDAGPAGSVEVRTPLSELMRHRDVVGQVTCPSSPPVTAARPARLFTVHAAAPPVGSVETSNRDAESVATHSDVLGQEMESSPTGWSMSASCHSDGPPAGWVDVSTSPTASTAAQKVAETQSMSERAGAVLPAIVLVHTGDVLAGSVEEKA